MGSLSTAIKVLSLFEIRTGKDANEEMENNTLGLIYAEKDYDKEKEHDFEIY